MAACLFLPGTQGRQTIGDSCGPEADYGARQHQPSADSSWWMVVGGWWLVTYRVTIVILIGIGSQPVRSCELCYSLVTGWLQVGYRLVTGWLQVSYRLVTGWLQVSCRLVTGWLQVSYRLVTV